ncbi:unnamed protein product [Ascophyllum nodosum]
MLRSEDVSPGNPSRGTSSYNARGGSNESSTGTIVAEDFEANYLFRRFDLKETIEHGGHWEMVKAVDKENEHESKLYAIKKFWRWGIRKEHKEALFQEVEILKRLDHEHVVTIYHWFPNEAFHFYVVLEHLGGEELLDRVVAKTQESYSEEEARALCRTIIKTIGYVHKEKVVHRDIKPSSFALARPGDEKSIRLTGFGVACFLEDDGLVTSPVFDEETVAPEILEGKRHNTSVDMWNIGHVVHVLITGCEPVFDEETSGFFKRKKKWSLNLESESWKRTSQEAQDFVRRLLEKDPDNRMTSSEAIDHPWMHVARDDLASNDLGQNLRDFTLRNAKRKLKTAVRLYIIAGRYCGELKKSEAGGYEFQRAYKLGNLLGEGSFARVYRATVKTSKGNQPKEFAVKRLVRWKHGKASNKKVFDEVCVLGSLNHPNVIKMHDFYHDDPKFYYIVLELMRGGELFGQIQTKTRFNEKEARDTCRALLKALDYIHSRNVVHHDLKPENVLLASKSDCASIRLADFGFACGVSDELSTDCCGTPFYMAPEIIQRKLHGTPVDMWSMGVIIFNMLSGKHPFGKQYRFRKYINPIYAEIRKGQFDFDPRYWSTVSEDAKDLVKNLLKVNPSERLTACQALQHRWLLREGEGLVENDLGPGLQELRVFNARRKLQLKAAIKAVVAMNRMDDSRRDQLGEES